MKKIAASIAVCGLCVLAGSLLPLYNINASGTAGSTTDPLVTKSYVDQKFAELSAMITTGSTAATQPLVSENAEVKEQIIEEVMAQIDYFYGGAVTGGSFTPIALKAGEVLIGHEGTEIILRSGQAVAFVGVDNGVSNLTSGKELRNNDNVEINNLLLIPRLDSRGVKATTDIWVMIKGGYDITR